MWIGNFFLILLNLPLIGMWAKMLTIPYHVLFPGSMVFCAIGVFSLNNTSFDVYLMALFGVLGYVFAKLQCEPAPMLLGFVLGPMMEENLRRSLTLSRGDPLIFLRSPISVTMLIIALLALLLVLLPTFRKTREEAFVEED